jgi:hypothetical protein
MFLDYENIAEIFRNPFPGGKTYYSCTNDGNGSIQSELLTNLFSKNSLKSDMPSSSGKFVTGMIHC